jgi:hypothetical protein
MWVLDFLPFWVFHLILLVGVVGSFIAFFVGSIPLINKYIIPVKVVSMFLLVCGLYMEGGVSNQERWEAKVADAKLEMAKKDTASAEATTKVVTKYVTKVQVVKEKGDAIIKEVPTYITKTDDTQCVIPNGFVLLHDSASRNEVPDSTRGVDAGASEVKLSGVATTVTENYTLYHKVSEQLRSLQEWVREQQSIYNK